MTDNKKAEKKVKVGTLVRNNVYLFRIACKYAPLYVICTVVEGIAWGINNAIELYYTKMLFDMIGEGKPFLTVLNLIVFMAIYNLTLYLCHHSYWRILKPIIQKNLQYRLHSELFDKARSLDLACYDDPEFYNDYMMALDSTNQKFSQMYFSVSRLISNLIAIFAIFAILATINPLFLLFPIVGSVLAILIAVKDNKVNFEYKKGCDSDERIYIVARCKK